MMPATPTSPTLPSLAGVAVRESAPRPVEDTPLKIDVQRLDIYYGAKQALQDITIGIRANQVTAFIGPSGCGKSTARAACIVGGAVRWAEY